MNGKNKKVAKGKKLPMYGGVGEGGQLSRAKKSPCKKGRGEAHAPGTR